MTQPGAHSSGGIQHQPLAAGTPPAAAEPSQAAGLSFGWRVALFIWASAFVCLLAYELLNTLVRTLLHVF